MSRFKYFDIFGRELHEPAVTPGEPTPATGERPDWDRCVINPLSQCCCVKYQTPQCVTIHTNPAPTTEPKGGERFAADTLLGVFAEGKGEKIMTVFPEGIPWKAWQRVADYCNRVSDSRARAAEKAIAFIRQMLGLPVEQNGDDLLQRLSLLRRAEAEAAALRKAAITALNIHACMDAEQAEAELARLSALPVEKEEKA